MFFELGDCIDTKIFEIPFSDNLNLDNFYNASKVLVQMYADKNDFPTDLIAYASAVKFPISLICEHFKKTALSPDLQGLLMNNYSIYEIIGVNNIKNTTIKNLLPTPYSLYVRVTYYK